MTRTPQDPPAVTSLTVESIRADIAEVLFVEPEEIQEEQNLIDHGMDSIRLMTLVERWRAAGATIDPIDLADQPTVRQWSQLLNAG